MSRTSSSLPKPRRHTDTQTHHTLTLVRLTLMGLHVIDYYCQILAVRFSHIVSAKIPRIISPKMYCRDIKRCYYSLAFEKFRYVKCFKLIAFLYS